VIWMAPAGAALEIVTTGLLGRSELHATCRMASSRCA
jgi:hypothetical protein